MKKHLFLLLAALFPMLANAYDAKIGKIYYTFSGNNATVVSGVTISGSYSGKIVIPATVKYSGSTYNVTSIGSKAFQNCKGLTSVTIPESVTSIGNSAFHAQVLPSEKDLDKVKVLIK